MNRRNFIKSVGVAIPGLYLYQGRLALGQDDLTEKERLLLERAPYQIELFGTGTPLERVEAELILRPAQKMKEFSETVSVIPTRQLGYDTDKPWIVATLYPDGPVTITGYRVFNNKEICCLEDKVARISLTGGDSIRMTIHVQDIT